MNASVVTAVLPNGSLAMVIADDPGLTPAAEQIARLAAVVPPADWSARPVGPDENLTEVIR